MAQPSYPPMASPVTVVGQQFCSPYPVGLSIVRKLFKIAEDFTVTDVNGNLMFTVKRKSSSHHGRQFLLDAAGNPVLTLRRKVSFVHRTRWEAFRGKSKDSKDLLFSVKESSLFQLKMKLDVSLAANTREDHCDFKIKGSWFGRSCTITLGDASTIIAQMHKKNTGCSILLGKDNFGVTVYPYVDYAFIVALIVILEEFQRGGD